MLLDEHETAPSCNPFGTPPGSCRDGQHLPVNRQKPWVQIHGHSSRSFPAILPSRECLNLAGV